MLKFHLGPKCIYSTMAAYQGRTCSPGRTLPKGTSIRVYYQCRQLAKMFLLCAFFQKLDLHLGKQPYNICRILRKSFKKENKIDWLILLPRTRLIEIQDLSRDTVPLRLNRKYNHPSTVLYSTVHAVAERLEIWRHVILLCWWSWVRIGHRPEWSKSLSKMGKWYNIRFILFS